MALIITPAEIAAATGQAFVESDVQTAQDVVELFSGHPLSDTVEVDALTAADLRRLRMAVQWQAVYLAAHPDILSREFVKRASVNGASIERDSDGVLSPLAARCIKSLSWVAGAAGVAVTTLRPSLRAYVEQPDPWVLLSTGGRL